MRLIVAILIFMLAPVRAATAQDAARGVYLLKPEAVFDGVTAEAHRGWQVLVRGNRIAAVGSTVSAPAGATIVDLPGTTLMPGMIEGHSHLFLHPYNETPWDQQVLHESLALRTVRATVAARRTLMAGFTTVRDLGTEGAGYADAGLKQAIEQDIVPGPRMLIASRALVAPGAYGPRGFEPGIVTPLGAEEADGPNLVTAVRRQIAAGADVVKLYADYRWGTGEPSRPTYLSSEMAAAVEAAHSAGRKVAAHAHTAEGMRRAILAGVDTIEHGGGGTAEIFALMKARGVGLCPTLAASDATSVAEARRAFAAAMKAGVAICVGGDVGVFPHGDNAREAELMAAAGMSPAQVAIAATSGNAAMFGVADRIGALKPGMMADLIAVEGNPLATVGALRKIRFVMKDGAVFAPLAH